MRAPRRRLTKSNFCAGECYGGGESEGGREGRRDNSPEAVSLTLDGKECTNSRCGFEAKKGQTYRLSAKTVLPTFDELCIVVARP